MSETHDLLAHVHVQKQEIAEWELIPPHDPRETTPAYQAAHHHLVYELDTPCTQCGVRQSTLGNPAANRFKATQMESHHRHIMRSLANACDPAKVAADFPDAGITDQESLLRWVDSEANMQVLCSTHHRSPTYGIHHVPSEVFRAQRYFWDGWLAVADTPAEAAADLPTDDAIMRAQHEES